MHVRSMLATNPPLPVCMSRMPHTNPRSYVDLHSIALVPLQALFFRVVFTKAQLMIVFISASFFWLLSLTATSIVWFVIPPLKDVPWFYVTLGVLVEEALRLVFFRLYARSESSFSVISTNAVVFPLTDITSSFSAGLGYGLTQAVLVYGSVVASSSGGGTYFTKECSEMSIFVLSGKLPFPDICVYCAVVCLLCPAVYAMFVCHGVYSSIPPPYGGHGGKGACQSLASLNLCMCVPPSVTIAKSQSYSNDHQLPLPTYSMVKLLLRSSPSVLDDYCIRRVPPYERGSRGIGCGESHGCLSGHHC